VTLPIWVVIHCAGDGHSGASEQAARVQRDFPCEGADEQQGIEVNGAGGAPHGAFVHIVLGGPTLSPVQRAYLREEGVSYQYWGLSHVLRDRRRAGVSDPSLFANWLALQQDDPGYDWTRVLFLYAADCLNSPVLALSWVCCTDAAPRRGGYGEGEPAWWTLLAARVEQHLRLGLPLNKAVLQQELEVVMDEWRVGAREDSTREWRSVLPRKEPRTHDTARQPGTLL
jgi:hypothetical protein